MYKTLRPTFERLEDRVVCDGSIEGNVILLDPNRPLTNESLAIDLVGQYLDIEVYSLTGTYHFSVPIDAYTQIQQLASAGIVIGYNVAGPTTAPPTYWDMVVSTYEDLYTFFVGHRPIVAETAPPSYFDQVIENANTARVPLFPVGP